MVSWMLSMACGGIGAAQGAPVVTLTCGARDVSAPVTVALPAGAEAGSGELVPADGTGAVAWQASRLGPWAGGQAWAGALLAPGPALDGARFTAEPSGEARPAAFRFDEADEGMVVVLEGDQAVLAYRPQPVLAEGVPEQFRRAGYVHPIHGLDGEVLTDDFPKDHYHHRGLYWAWPYIDVTGQRVSSWYCQGIETRCDRWLGREAGPVYAVFGLDNGWYVGDREVVDEVVWYRVWSADRVGRAIDVDIVWTAGDDPVVLTGVEEKGYGGFCLRFAPREATVITTDAGRLAEDTLEVPYAWADLSARFAGRTEPSGAAVFIDAANPGFPNGWITRHYGFLGVNWPGLRSVTLEPHQPVHLRYRVWVHRGDADSGAVAAAYEAFHEPAQVELRL